MGTKALRRGLALVALAAAILVPAASAKSTPRIRLSVIPLPKSSLGPAARGLAIAQDSGVIKKSDVPPGFKQLGYLTGYLLQYGDPYRGGTGVTAVATDVNKYRTAGGAKRGVALGHKGDVEEIATLKDAGLAFTGEALARPKLGGRSFAFLWASTVAGVDPVSIVDVQWMEGWYTLQVQVAAGSSSAAESLARKLAKRLDKRLRLALARRLHAKPVSLPAKLKPGPPPGGPSLAALALQAADLGGVGTIDDQFYVVAPPALSEYELNASPTNGFDDLSQVIDWWGSTNEATFYSSVEFPLIASDLAALFGVPGDTSQPTPVDVSSVGDGAQAEILAFSPTNDSPVYFAIVALTSGQATDLLFTISGTAIQPSDVQNVVQAAANRFDAGLAG
jgi:hypothetical protein